MAATVFEHFEFREQQSHNIRNALRSFSYPNTMQYGLSFKTTGARVPTCISISSRYELKPTTGASPSQPLYPNTGQIPVDKNNIARALVFRVSRHSERSFMVVTESFTAHG
jgi:hypothetical protein